MLGNKRVCQMTSPEIRARHDWNVPRQGGVGLELAGILSGSETGRGVVNHHVIFGYYDFMVLMQVDAATNKYLGINPHEAARVPEFADEP